MPAKANDGGQIRRWTAAALVLLVLALASVLIGVVNLVKRDREKLIEQFAADRAGLVREASRGVADALDDVGEDLRFAAELLAQPMDPSAHQRELRALLEVVGQYKALAVFEADGKLRFSLTDRRAGSSVHQPIYKEALAATARRALASLPGAITTSPALGPPPGGWLRVMATGIGTPEAGTTGAVAVLIDTEPFFDALRIVASQPDSRLLLLGAHGLPTPGTDRELADWVHRLDRDPELAPRLGSVVREMRAGTEGWLRLGEDEAALLGLGPAEAIAAFLPIQVKAGAHWSVATMNSTTALRSHERAIAVRFGLAAALIALFLTAFGAWALWAARRQIAMRERLHHADRLAHLHEKNQKILDNIPTGVLALSSLGKVSAVNQALEARLPGSAIGADLAGAFSKAPPSTLERLTALVDSACHSGRVTSLHGEPLALFGNEGHYSLHAVPLEPRDPEVRALLVVEDLTGVKALENQLLRAEKLATVGILGAGIAHEIGTPLGVVRGRAEYMLDKLGPDHPQASGLGVIVSQIDRVSRTIRELLDFSRIRPPLVRPTALAPIAHSVGELLHAEAERRKLSLQVEVTDELPLLSADPDQLQQVLVNLALNACDACRPGGNIRITARLPSEAEAADGAPVRLEVWDDGCGIPSEHVNRVFDPFFTTKKRGQGTGLGLTVVAQVVQSHGGRIEVDSEPDRGTRVSIFWPTAPPAKQERHAH